MLSLCSGVGLEKQQQNSSPGVRVRCVSDLGPAGPSSVTYFRVLERAGAEETVWHVCCVYHVQQERLGRKEKKKRERKKIGSERSSGGRCVCVGGRRRGIWEQKHRKNNRKGKLRDQA